MRRARARARIAKYFLTFVWADAKNTRIIQGEPVGRKNHFYVNNNTPFKDHIYNKFVVTSILKSVTT